ncbi:L-aspartate dehydrogenase [Brachionus plicatilis]|uniref:Aspartate dehydrogenase domain-containing protein n=1 Tax=Brachionus plicatilis TaxID=10195 RepID=A0A3M7QB03_BRAPC|nr:L-aspartate dehydrogenase [Brachionus plicatilis]
MKRVGIVGFGHLGKYLYDRLSDDKNFEIVFIWNRSRIDDQSIDKKLVLADLEDFKNHKVDLIIEVAHPIITQNYGQIFLEHTDYVIGSPTALANQEVLDNLISTSLKFKTKIYVPCGAFWGANDIKKMAAQNTLKGLKITMKKHQTSLKLEGELRTKLENNKIWDSALVLYEGPVRDLCYLAPNNVNTMAVGALSALNLGFDKVQACLIADPSLTDKHVIEIEVTGPFNDKLNQNFKCTTVRSNPAVIGHVTGNQTYASFFYSLLETLSETNASGIIVC